MNASLVCFVAALSAAPFGDHSEPISPLSDHFAAAIRGQAPTYQEVPQSPMFDAPAGQPQFQPQPEFQPSPFPGQPPIAPNGGFMTPFEPAPSTFDTFPGQTFPGVIEGECPPLCPPPPRGGIFVGYESVIVKPYFSGNVSDRVFDPETGMFHEEFPGKMQHSPRVWLGIVSPGGLGVQARYYQFHHRMRRKHPGVDQMNDILIFTPNPDLELHALDLEGLARSDFAWGSITVTGGVRYAKVAQTFGREIDFGEPDNGPVLVPPFLAPPAVPILVPEPEGELVGSTFFAHRRFEGAGPTISLTTRRNIGFTNFALFASSRFSAVYGRASEASITQLRFEDEIIQTSRRDRINHLIAISELQVGAEWGFWLSPQTELVLRTALEGQFWFDAATSRDNFRDTGNLGLLGLTVGAGLMF